MSRVPTAAPAAAPAAASPTTSDVTVTTATAAAAEVGPGEPPAPVVKRLRAAFGDIINPNTLHRFTVENEVKVVMDPWTTMQLEAGKLIEVD